MQEITTASVVGQEKLSSDIMRFDLMPHGDGIFFEPGGHVDILIPIDGGTQVRSYSHVGIGPDHSLQIAVKLMPDSRGGSSYMWKLRPCDEIKVQAARNNFPLSYAAERYRLLAGGIGITPIIGMARALKEARKEFELLYCVQKADDAAFLDELEAEFGECFSLNADDVQGMPDLGEFVAQTPLDAEVYMCGPLPMMDAVKHAWARDGRATARLRYETFGSTGAADAMPFSVTVMETGETITVPKDSSLLEELIRTGHPVMYDCRRGECGLCKVEIDELEGDVDHRDVFLSGEERRQGRSMCACVSRLSSGHARIHIDHISHGRS